MQNMIVKITNILFNTFIENKWLNNQNNRSVKCLKKN